jgi:hypothetical protein
MPTSMPTSYVVQPFRAPRVVQPFRAAWNGRPKGLHYIVILLFATTAFAQDMNQMSGVPLPSGDLPDRTISVRVVRGALTNNVQRHEVELLVAGTPRKIATDANGRAIFSELPAGATVQAVTTLDGKRLASQSFEVPSKGGVRLILVGPPPEKQRQVEPQE